jgi:hypothetical protein
MNRICLLITLIIFVFIIPRLGAEILGEMAYEDISERSDIRTMVPRQENETILVVISRVPNLRFDSNNVINDVEKKEAGKWIVHLRPGTHRLSFQADHYLSVTHRLVAQRKTVYGARLKIVKPYQPDAETDSESYESALLDITSEPSGAGVYIDDEYKGTTPYVGRVMSGSYDLRLEKDLYLPLQQKIVVAANETKRLSLSLKANFGSVRIESSPENARAFIDEKYIGTTPVTSPSLQPGRHSLRLQKEMYHDKSRQVTVTRGETETVQVILEPAFGGLVIRSEPSGAEVLIDGKSAGPTPFRDSEIASASYQVTISLPMYRDVSRMIEVRDGRVTEELFRLDTNFGTLYIEAPPLATVYIDGEPAGNGSMTKKLDGGLHRIEARQPRHNSDRHQVDITVGEERRVSLSPEPRTGKLLVYVEPDGARNADIFIDGKSYGRAPAMISDLLEGEYALLLQHDDYLPVEKTVSVEYDKEREITIPMVTYHGSQQAKKDAWGRRRNLTLIASLTSLGAGGAFAYLSESQYDQYLSARTVDEITAARQKVENYDTFTMGALGTAGVFALWTLYNQIRCSGVDVPERRVSLKMDPDKGMVGVAVNF